MPNAEFGSKYKSLAGKPARDFLFSSHEFKQFKQLQTKNNPP
jgi:hypothetical protein